jgi:hypothetical protein
MAMNSTIEDRLEAVEKSLAELKREMEIHKASPDWLTHVIGIFKDEPAFDVVMRLGREFRMSDRPDEDSSL